MAVAGLSFLAACGGGHDDPGIVTLAQTDARFSILAEAVTAAGLAPTLQGSGPFGIVKVNANGAALSVQDGRNRLAAILAAGLAATNGVLHAIVLTSNGVIHVLDRVILPAP